ncbi:uncharacterized protein LOC109420363 [Aedes albopictus]|uniref:Farnesoic acid O-methyl transferase domain-containing protein n=1 Tax=Aedes albopictus TaxID=7160 RepID=A0ABM1ZKJ2_AEDAL
MRNILLFCLLQFSFAIEYNPKNFINTFEATYGCLQFSTKDACQPYFPTNRFKHLHTTHNNVTIMRMGVMANQGPHIRLSPNEFPDDTKITEIVLSAWENTASEMRSYVRHINKPISDLKILKRINTPGLLNQFYPMMFTLEIDPNGNVKLIKDGDRVPLVEFQNRAISFEYIEFCHYIAPATFFFDCPLEIDRRDCSGIVLG